MLTETAEASGEQIVRLLAEQARRVGVVLDRLGVRRTTVVGHSTGGAVATSPAEQRRDLVVATALIEATAESGGTTGRSALRRLAIAAMCVRVADRAS
ncbi:alpha/beta fold hydrolase [Streptomyces acidicola]|uniref:alpha/beta fold hydrolase n=1 Tax=Streptomyces acidicola TaxID=2596892 RepID=UPI003899FB18